MKFPKVWLDSTPDRHSRLRGNDTRCFLIELSPRISLADVALAARTSKHYQSYSQHLATGSVVFRSLSISFRALRHKFTRQHVRIQLRVLDDFERFLHLGIVTQGGFDTFFGAVQP